MPEMQSQQYSVVGGKQIKTMSRVQQHQRQQFTSIKVWM